MNPEYENRGPNIPQDDTNNRKGNGQIDGTEYYQLFEDLMYAKLISGNYNGTSDLPKHPFGDSVQIYWVNPPGDPGQGHYIRFDNLPWDVCQEIDLKYDDGVWNTGSIVGSEDYIEANSPVAYFYMPL